MRVRMDEDEAIEIQMAPMIDCVFLLLIFFLVATTMKKIEPELPITLPFAGAALDTPVVDDTLVIGVDVKGQRYLRGEPVSTEMLHQALRERAVATERLQKVRIDADQDVTYRNLVEIIELCQFWGLRDVGLHTREAP